MRLIGITGPAGSGKSTIANFLVIEYGFKRIRFAGPLKEMLRAIGLKHEDVDGADKEKPCDILEGKTPRHAMQTLGTEWGRNLIGPNLWLNLWERAVVAAEAEGAPGVVVDDLRFPNEYLRCKSLDGFVLRVVRPGFTISDVHVSEAHELPYDGAIVNDRTIDDLRSEFYGVFGL